ncbi:hypothetical protein O0880_13500 [Janthinobacterium sp. SUN118]|uniref:hypothetical protein n=1 Tax=Janthinobacterium sp. SUN118 TaxID=3004100 RepID=UPI0025B02E21|nr:hypothetical protein [Janthinobacterium sp. SUN118]MDN2710434.1 hypothetical protein [Janthinobacterium sp. SUN118]
MNVIKQALLALLLCAMSAAHATSIGYTATALGGTQWRYDYTVSNTTLAVPIEEFTVFFSVGPYINLQNVSTAPGWDFLLVQPDPAIPDSGYLDVLALAGGIAPSATATGFSVTFDYLGVGSPGPQLFVVLDPVSFIELDTGSTQAVPLPATPCLLLAGVLAMLCLRRRQLAVVALAASLCACGGSNDPTQPPTPKVMLAADMEAAADKDALADKDAAAAAMEATTATAPSVAVGPFDVTSLRKTAERRINRRIYEYTFRISIRNNGSETANNVHAVLAGIPAGATVVDGDVQAGSIAAGATVTATDVVVLRINRTRPFELGGLIWNITAVDSVALDAVRPAQVVVLSLAELGLPDGADSVKASGAISDVLLRDGTLRFSTPGDTGVDQHAQLFISRGGAVSVFDVLIQTELPTAVDTYVEPLDDGSLPPTPPQLAITGLGANNTLLADGLAFRLSGAPAMALQNDSDGFLAAPGGPAISLKSYWVFHPDTGSFTIGATAMQLLLAVLPSGALDMNLNFVSEDGEFSVSYALSVIKSNTVLLGQMRTPAGGNATGLAGKKILLTGYNSHQRRVAVIDATGAFRFDGVIPDTYQLTLNDLEHPNVVSISAAVFPGSTTVNVGIVYPFATALAPPAAANTYTAGTVTQDGAAPSARGGTDAGAGAAPPDATPLDDEGSQTFSATAAAQNNTMTTPIVYTVPKGTKNVGVKITVSTAEYPVYTTQQSRYNDTWSYSVVGLPGANLAAAGAVNQSHFTQGTIVRTDCIDVSKQTQNGPLAVGGGVSATNIGDNLLPTVTRVELSLVCKGLKITKARFLSPNKDAHPILQPIRVAGNLPGPYVSVSQGATTPTHTVPLELQYTPAAATITEVNIGISASGGNPSFSADNLLAQANTKNPGKVKFPGLVLPTFAGAKIDKKAVVTIRLKGQINGTEATSDPNEGGQVDLKGDTAFIPLYLANNEAALAARRYGSRDAGGDSWATRLTIAWLLNKPYRFDDISGQHVTQTAAGRSILGHSGHSDGQQIDMRYADGAGGYADTLGGQGNGAGIRKLIDDAQAEVAAGQVNKPRLALLVAWITANRAMLTLEAAAADTRVIYIGHSFVKLALVDGRFANPPKGLIPGAGAWAKPAKVSIDPAHLSHWHLSLTAHP